MQLALLGACLLIVAAQDLRDRRIPNAAILALLALALPRLLAAWKDGTIWTHLSVAATMFALFLGAYRAGLIGGGDTKLLGAAILWIGPQSAIVFAVLLFAAALGVAALLWARALATARPLRGQAMPFGPPIAFAWMGTALLGSG